MRTAVIAAALCLTACADPAPPSEAPRGADEGAAQTELRYLLDADEAARAFADGIHQIVPARAFRTLDLHYVAPAGAALEAQLLLGEVWSAWRPVEGIAQDDGRFSAAVEAPNAAYAIRLRGGAGLEFARFEFFSSLPPEGLAAFDDDPHGSEGHGDEAVPLSAALEEKIARDGRWALPASTRSAGEARRVPYTGAPSWSGGRNCSGGLTAGARRLGQHLVDTFPGARSYQGYACRQIRGSSGMSVHGTGRAVDVFIPLHGGSADNDLGDPVANWLVENAADIGIQLIIWDRSIWSGSRSPRDRRYGGSHPHHDHLHIELTPQASRMETAFFRGGVAPPDDVDGGAGAGEPGCHSATLGRTVDAGTCVQTSYPRCGGTCTWSVCRDGAWQCAGDAACEESFAHAACAPARPAPRQGCQSRTVGRAVDDGACVQMPYDACGGTCQWARCDDGGWTCTEAAACAGETHPSGQCGGRADAVGEACASRTLGRSVPHGDRVQMAYDACGGTCQWAACDDGEWDCTDGAAAGADHPHADCRPRAPAAGASCYSRTLGRSVPHGDRVQMSYAACADDRRCNWAVCDDGEWDCTEQAGSGQDHGHASCR